MMQRLIAGNWKMNGLHAEALALASALADRAKASVPACAVMVAPPATVLAPVAAAIAGTPIALGAQTCHAEASGAFTGEIAAEMLADAGCSHVIVGHSERRHGLGETDAVVRGKTAAAWRAGLVAIVCVGETAEERDAGRTLDVVLKQLAGSVPDGAGGLVLAYEPVWAIGSGRVPTADDIAAVHAGLRGALRERGAQGAAAPILYGGSAKPANAGELLAIPEVGGLLVGGASLDAESFWSMVEACS
jgi:triosephosphate isomerase